MAKRHAIVRRYVEPPKGGRFASGANRYSAAERATDAQARDEAIRRGLALAKACYSAGVPRDPMPLRQKLFEARKLGDSLD